MRRAPIGALAPVLAVLALAGCYRHVPTREPGRELTRVRLTTGEEIDVQRRHRAYWQDSTVVVEQHLGDEDPRVIAASEVEQSWTREFDRRRTIVVLAAGGGVLFGAFAYLAYALSGG